MNIRQQIIAEIKANIEEEKILVSFWMELMFAKEIDYYFRLYEAGLSIEGDFIIQSMNAMDVLAKQLYWKAHRILDDHWR